MPGELDVANEVGSMSEGIACGVWAGAIWSRRGETTEAIVARRQSESGMKDFRPKPDRRVAVEERTRL